ncbi:Protein of unknown function (Hypoth_ymh) [Fodinibius salinus]|uniref:Conserved hypothetical protein CHP02391 domain-containing protein n=1 Tax=Fodinibius salinus TaxID=860790 RepID=A0A5D3YLF9_9BACT|nr:TIGR02391 family protein [Fodinibius salinus]TYP93527.1 Protein of unknown function (Hypoth_ymh) [Fodinibius salinus]
MTENQNKELAGIQYVGISGGTNDCKEAVLRIIQSNTSINHVWILSNDNHHALLLDIGVGDFLAVKSGFASDYRGGGATAFSFILALLDKLEIDVSEISVSEDFLSRLDASALTKDDIERIEKSESAQAVNWGDYVLKEHLDLDLNKTLNQKIAPILPLGLIEPRLLDLASKFRESPNEQIFQGYKRLEDVVRERTGIEEHGSKLFSKSFLEEDSVLYWPDINTAEQKGRAQIFVGVYMAFRNPKAHREQRQSLSDQISEFLLLNKLFQLEAESDLRKNND